MDWLFPCSLEHVAPSEDLPSRTNLSCRCCTRRWRTNTPERRKTISTRHTPTFGKSDFQLLDMRRLHHLFFESSPSSTLPRIVVEGSTDDRSMRTPSFWNLPSHIASSFMRTKGDTLRIRYTAVGVAALRNCNACLCVTSRYTMMYFYHRLFTLYL